MHESMKSPDAVTTVTEAELEALQNAARLLEALQNAGVDNWSGYSYAMEEFHGEAE